MGLGQKKFMVWSVWQYTWLGGAPVQCPAVPDRPCRLCMVLPTFLSDQSQNEMYIFGYNIPLSFTYRTFFLALYQWMTTWTDIQSELNLHAVWQTALVQTLCLFSVWPIHWTLVLSLSIQVKHDTTHYWHYWSDVKRLIVVLN